MDILFKRAKWQQDSDGMWVSLLVEDRKEYPAVRRFLATMGDKLHSATIGLARKKRSLDANAYCWELIGKLSAKLRVPPEEIYREAVREIGDNSIVVPVRADGVERWKEIWRGKGLGWVSEELGASKLPGYVNVVNYYGSSVYDSAQMSRLIDIIISECKEQDIETLPPDKVVLLKDGWRDTPRKDTT